MLFKKLNFLIFFAIALTLGACADKTRWEHPGLSETQWVLDQSSCKNAAILEVNIEITLERGSAARGNDFHYDQYSNQMARYQWLKKQKKLIRSCLIKKGYQKVELNYSKNKANAQK